jgi:hypothetical protein
MNERIQGFIVLVMYIPGSIFLAIGLVVEEPPVLHSEVEKQQPEGSEPEGVVAGTAGTAGTTAGATAAVQEEHFTTGQIVGFYMKGASAAGALQLTGVGILVSFGPLIVGRAGLDPLLGYFLISLAKFIGALLGFIAVWLTTPLKSFTVGLGMCSACCFLIFIGIFPGIVDEGTPTIAVTFLGMILFPLSFNATVGPQSWTLMAAVFPPKYRESGCTMSVAANAFLTFILNFIFPTAVQGISGGPAGNQGYGYGGMFLILSVVAAISCVLTKIFTKVYVPPAAAQDQDC